MGKDFRGKLNAYKKNCGLSDEMIHCWQRPELSKKEAKERFWIIVFTKPTDYEYLKDETKWYTKIYVWDTHEEKWHTQITTTKDYISGKLFISYPHERLVFISGPRVVIYSFHKDQPLAIYKHEYDNEGYSNLSCGILSSDIIVVNASKAHWSEFDMRTHTQHIYLTRGNNAVFYGTIIQHLHTQIAMSVTYTHDDSVNGQEITIWKKHTIEKRPLEKVDGYTGQNRLEYRPVHKILTEDKLPDDISASIDGNVLSISAGFTLPIAQYIKE